MDWSELKNSQATLLHLESMVTGSVTDYFDGIERKYVGADGREVVGPVVCLGPHTFVADDSHFLVLNAAEANAFYGMVSMLQNIVKDWFSQMDKAGFSRDMAFDLTRSACAINFASLTAARQTPDANATSSEEVH